MGGAAFLVPRGQMQGDATQEMRGHRRGAATPQTSPATLKPEGRMEVARRSLRCSSSTMAPHRLLLASCARRASPMRAIPPNTRTGSQPTKKEKTGTVTFAGVADMLPRLYWKKGMCPRFPARFSPFLDHINAVTIEATTERTVAAMQMSATAKWSGRSGRRGSSQRAAA